MAGRWAAQCRSLSPSSSLQQPWCENFEVMLPEQNKTTLPASEPRQRGPKGPIACSAALLQPGMQPVHQSARYAFSDS